MIPARAVVDSAVFGDFPLIAARTVVNPAVLGLPALIAAGSIVAAAVFGFTAFVASGPIIAAPVLGDAPLVAARAVVNTAVLGNFSLIAAGVVVTAPGSRACAFEAPVRIAVHSPKPASRTGKDGPAPIEAPMAPAMSAPAAQRSACPKSRAGLLFSFFVMLTSVMRE